MERRGEDSLRQDAIDAAANNIFSQREFGDLVQQAMIPPVPAQEVTIVDFQGEPNLVSGQKTPSASF